MHNPQLQCAPRCAHLTALRLSLLAYPAAKPQTQLPEGMVLERVRGGVAQVAVPGQYSAELTLVPAPRDEVTLAKYRPPEDAQPSSAGAWGGADVDTGRMACGGRGLEGGWRPGKGRPLVGVAPNPRCGSLSGV